MGEEKRWWGRLSLYISEGWLLGGQGNFLSVVGASLGIARERFDRADIGLRKDKTRRAHDPHLANMPSMPRMLSIPTSHAAVIYLGI